jgi:outer membrane protein assembly factor BamA
LHIKKCKNINTEELSGEEYMKLINKLMFCFCLIWLPLRGESIQISLSQNDSTGAVITDSLSTRLVTIHDVFILGNAKTKKEIITRELTYKKGEIVPLNLLYAIRQEDRNKIYNTNLFNTAELTILVRDDTSVDLFIKVTERWYFYPSLNAELGDRNINDWLFNRNGSFDRFNFGLKLDKYNFRGRKERLIVGGQIGLERQLLLEYKIPYIEKSLRHGLQFGVNYSEIREGVAYQTFDHRTEILNNEIDLDQINRTTFASNINYSFRPNFYQYHQVLLQYNDRRISDTLAFFNPNYFGEGRTQQRLFKLAYAFADDQRNNRNYPLRGYYFFGFVEKVGIGLFGDADIWRLTARFSKYFELKNKFYLGFNVSGFISSQNDVPYFNFSGLGYGNYLVRGYNKELIEGHTNFLTKISLKRKLFGYTTDISRIMPLKQFQKVPLQVFAKLFVDTGWTANYSDHTTSDRLSNRFLYGIGVGLDFLTINDLLPQVEASINAEGDYNVYLGVKVEF